MVDSHVLLVIGGAGVMCGSIAECATVAKILQSNTQVFVKGGESWHLDLETISNMNIIHVGRHPEYGIHVAFGSVKPYVANLHIYLQKAFPFFQLWKP